MHIIETGNGLADISKALSFLENVRCLVGIPQEHSSRHNDEITNAELAFIHTYGSPVRNIPPRPFIEPAIAQPDVMQKIAENMRDAALQAIDGNTGVAITEMHKAGQRGQDAVKDYIDSGKLTPNSEATIKRKGSNAPLIDTGSLRSSVTYIVEER